MKLHFLSLFLLANVANALQVLQPINPNTMVKQQDHISPITQEKSAQQMLVSLKKYAKSGDASAQFSLANMYHYGIDVVADPKLALYWYKQVANQGYASAQFNVATGYYQGVGVAKDLEQARVWYEKSAKQGFAKAQHNLATMYRLGDGTKIDHKQAFEWYKKAYKKDIIEAGYYVAISLLTGQGTDKNTEAALSLLTELSEQKYAPAQYQLGLFYQQKHALKDAIKWLNLAAMQDYAPAKIRLADIQPKTNPQAQIKTQTNPKTEVEIKPKIQNEPKVSTIFNTSTDTERVKTPIVIDRQIVTIKTTPIALTIPPSVSTPSQFQIMRSLLANNQPMPDIKSLILRAKQGDSIAQYNLGILFGKGQLVPKDNNKAFKLIQISAKQGLTQAQNALAMMYIDGVGVEPNIQLANFWAQASARQGDQKGAVILLYLSNIVGVQ